MRRCTHPSSLYLLLLYWLLVPSIAIAAGREAIVREDIVAHGSYRFVMEQRVIHYDDEPIELLRTEKMEAVLVVYKNNQEIYRSEEGYKFYHDKEHHPAIGMDVTGDGTPDVVLADWSGGAHCCNTYYIIEMSEPLNVMTFALGDGGIRFENLNETLGLELNISDDNFAYWRTSFAGSAFPRVIFRYQNGQYAFDTALTRKPSPSRKQLQNLSSRIRNSKWDPAYLPKEFLQMTMDLIFTGNVVQALEFIESAWSPGQPGKDDFIAELFQCRLREDRLWAEIAQMNNLRPDKPLEDCGKRFPDRLR